MNNHILYIRMAHPVVEQRQQRLVVVAVAVVVEIGNIVDIAIVVESSFVLDLEFDQLVVEHFGFGLVLLVEVLQWLDRLKLA